MDDMHEPGMELYEAAVHMRMAQEYLIVAHTHRGAGNQVAERINYELAVKQFDLAAAALLANEHRMVAA